MKEEIKIILNKIKNNKDVITLTPNESRELSSYIEKKNNVINFLNQELKNNRKERNEFKTKYEVLKCKLGEE